MRREISSSLISLKKICTDLKKEIQHSDELGLYQECDDLKKATILIVGVYINRKKEVDNGSNNSNS